MSKHFRRDCQRDEGDQFPLERQSEWNNKFQDLENELDEKIIKEKHMCSEISNLKQDLENKLRQLDQNESHHFNNDPSGISKKIGSRRNLLSHFKQKNILPTQSSLQQASSNKIDQQITLKRNTLHEQPKKLPLSSSSSRIQTSKYSINSSHPTQYIQNNADILNSFATPEYKELVRIASPEQRQVQLQSARTQAELERELMVFKQTNELQERELSRMRQMRRVDEDRMDQLQKDTLDMVVKLKESETKNARQMEKIKDMEWENERLMEEVNMKESRLKQIRDNNQQVKEYENRMEQKAQEIVGLQQQIDQINEKHQQYKQAMQARDQDIKNEIKTSELIIHQQEQEIENLNEQVKEYQDKCNRLLREQQISIDIEEDWKNEISMRIQKEKEIEDLEREIKDLKENQQIIEVKLQGKMLVLFAENERLHQVNMNMQLEIKTLKGQIAQYQQNTFNISFNSLGKQAGANASAEELDKIKLHLQVKIKENEILRNQLQSLENCPSIISELERKLQLQIAENKQITQIMYGRINQNQNW